MAYADQTRRPSPTSMIAVAAVHAAIGTALITGLSFTGVLKPPPRPLSGAQIELPKPPPPEPTPEPQPAPRPQANPRETVVAPKPPVSFPSPKRDFDTTEIIIPRDPVIWEPVPKPTKAPVSQPSAAPTTTTVAPLAPRPRNDPGRWITTNDYRSSWIAREMTGTAQFRLAIAADGRVTNCTIAGSTGHPALDNATCRLLEQRARFEPARNASGDAVASSYASAVSWVLPD